MNKYTLFALLATIFMSLSAIAQQNVTITGRLVDKDGQSVIGATILEKGTTNAVLSDVDGNFAIKLPKGNTIVIRYLGFKPQEIVALSPLSSPIVMEDDAVAIDNVVVIGYGTARKTDMTGSVVAVKADLKDRGLVNNASQLLVGKVPGVQITPGDGQPGGTGTIRIRGGASLSASNDPLVVVDGVPVQSGGLGVVNPNDIATMTVLKDASAAAIYGSRGSNGVVIITTKKGSGKFRLNYNSTYSLSQNSKTVQTMNATEYREVMDKYYPTTTPLGAEAHSLMGKSETNWQDKVFRLGLGTDQYISGSGKVSTMGYRVGLGYTNENGTLRGSNFERYTGSIGLSPKFFDEHLSIDINAKISYTNNKNADAGAVGSAAFFDPTQDVYVRNADGSLNSEKFNGYFTWVNSSNNPNILAPTNPVALLEQAWNNSHVTRTLANAQIDYKMHFLPELRANLNLGMDITDGRGDNGVFENSPQAWRDNEYAGIGRNNSNRFLNRNNLLDFYLNYVKDITAIESRIDVMGGYSWQHFYQSNSNQTFPNNAVEGSDPIFKNDFATENYLVSFFGRLNYVFKEKYSLTATVRYDGSSRFSPSTRWGLFPSMAFAWDLKNENALRRMEKLSTLKLRLGYGTTGQQDLGLNDYPYIPRYNISNQYSMYQFGDKFYNVLKPNAYDENIKWEETTTYNIGIDFGWWNNRLNGSLDLYYKETKDLLNTIPVPAGANFSNMITTNIGNLNNRGAELNLNVIAIQQRDWNWTIGFNATWNKTQITKLTANDDPNYLGVTTGEVPGSTGAFSQLQKVGYSPYTFYVFEQVYGADGKPLQNTFVDRNEDGIITEADRYLHQKPAPDAYFGLSSQLSYKNWYFAFNARANVGNYMYNAYAANNSTTFAGYGGQGFLTNLDKTIHRTGFTQANTINQRISDYWIENASFLRMDNITIGYDFPSLFGSKVGGRLSFTAQNVFVITNYKGLDPEGWGVDNVMWPRPRTYVLGLTLNF